MPEVTSTERAFSEARDRYNDIESRLSVALARQPSAESYLQEQHLRRELEEAARAVVAARDEHERVVAEVTVGKQAESSRELADAEAQLRMLAPVAEQQIGVLADTIAEILDASRRRYAATHTVNGSAPRHLLGRTATAEWVRHRLAALEADLGRAERHYRKGLIEALSLGIDEEPADE